MFFFFGSLVSKEKGGISIQDPKSHKPISQPASQPASERGQDRAGQGRADPTYPDIASETRKPNTLDPPCELLEQCMLSPSLIP